MDKRQCEIAAEAITAAQFARFGFDVSVQYGANQPEYDLIVARGAAMLKISVKGSNDGSWALLIGDIKKAGKGNYHGAADLWLARHTERTAVCLVQFKGVADDDLPRAYLAWPKEIARQIEAARGGRGNTILHERHEWGKRAAGAGTTDALPLEWKLTKSRIKEMLCSLSEQRFQTDPLPRAPLA